MKKKFYILMCLASLVLMVTACGGKEKIKEKLRAATEAVKERKEAAVSEKGSDPEMDKQGDRPDSDAFVDPSLTPAQRKALDKDNPWFARDFRMELKSRQMGSIMNVEIQKSGNVVYYHFWNNSGDVETLLVIGEEVIKAYRISMKSKVAKFQRDYEEDYYTVFCNTIGDVHGIIYKENEERTQNQGETAMIESEVLNSIDVKEERWNGFDCEKIIHKTVMNNRVSEGVKALEGLFGFNLDLENSMKSMEHMEITDNIWIEKNSGAVVRRETQSVGAMAQSMMNMAKQPSVALLTFSPDPSLIPTSLEGYKLVK